MVGELDSLEPPAYRRFRTSCLPPPSLTAMSAAAAPTADLVRPSGALPQVQVILEQIKSLDTIALLQVASAATTLASKNVKRSSSGRNAPKSAPASKKRGKKATKKSDASEASDSEKPKSKRSGSHLVKYNAWVNFVAKHASTNGWPAFLAKVTTTDKATKEKTESMKEMPESEEKDGKFVFPDGTVFDRKLAKSLSNLYWSVKTKSGDRQDLYEAFEAAYASPSSAEGPNSAVEATTEAEEDD